MTGYEFPWERAAMRGDELPNGLDLVDQMAYTSLRHIYWLYHQKIISRDRAAAEKLRIRGEWDNAKRIIAFADESAFQRAKILKSTELAKTDCRKNPTAENALKLCDALDGILR